MRKELKYMIYSHLVILVVLLYLTFDLLTLAIDNVTHASLLHDDLNNSNSSISTQRLIPKIIHQTYKNTSIPDHWKSGQQNCIDLHPDYQYILWTDEMARTFIQENYPWFLKTFDGYKYPIQRADTIRYFILSHFGGIYIDLDDGCKRRLDPLLGVPAFLRKTTPTGVSNDVMGSVPGHPFFLKVINSLQKYNIDWLVPYITIMFSTGPLFLSVVWERYKRWGIPLTGEIMVLQPEDYEGSDFSFFEISRGSSWHLGDAQFIKSLSAHIPACVILGFVLAFLILYTEYLFFRWLFSGGARRLGNKIKSVLYRREPSILNEPLIACVSTQHKRLRKDSNLPPNIHLSDLEKQDPKFTDLSN